MAKRKSSETAEQHGGGTAAAIAEAPPPGAQQLIPLEAIRIGGANPRRHFDEAKMAELTESVRRHGVLQPVLVRHWPDPGSDRYELVAGERRYRAASKAGLSEIPTLIRELSDAQALELQVIENLQREDLHPLEEAEGYRQLHEVHGYAVEDLAAKVGKSRMYIYGRLKLCALSKPAKEAFLEGQFSASIALLLTRLQEPQQADALKELKRWGEDGPSYRDFADHVQSKYMLRLDGVPWKLDDADLVPKAGPCTTCPKRTGNQPELFSDVRSKDVCTDPGCYRDKQAATWMQVQAEAESEGLEVLGEKEVKKAFPYGDRPGHNSGFVAITERCDESPKGESWQKTLGKAAPPAVVAWTPGGAVVKLYREKEALDAARGKGYKWAQAHRSDAGSGSSDAADRRRMAEQRLKGAARREAIGRLVAAAEKREPPASIWREIAGAIMGAVWAQVSREIAQRRGIEAKGGGFGAQEAIKKLLAKMTPGQARGLALEVLVVRGLLDFGNRHDGARQLLRAFHIDLKAIENQLKVQQRAKAKEPRKTPSQRQREAGEAAKEAADQADLAKLPDKIPALVEDYRRTLQARHNFMLKGKVKQAQEATRRLDLLQAKANGGRSFGSGVETSPAETLRRQTAAPIGQEPLWGQLGVFRVEVDGVPYLVEHDTSMHLALHAEQASMRCISETGFHSFFPATPGSDEEVRASVADYVVELIREEVATVPNRSGAQRVPRPASKPLPYPERVYRLPKKGEGRKLIELAVKGGRSDEVPTAPAKHPARCALRPAVGATKGNHAPCTLEPGHKAKHKNQTESWTRCEKPAGLPGVPPRAVRCRACKAKPGFPCTGHTGGRNSKFHKVREQDATRVRQATPGICCRCGCVEAAACPGGCAWVNADRTVCSSCATPEELRAAQTMGGGVRRVGALSDEEK